MIRLRSVIACQRPPRAVGMPRALEALATVCRVSAPPVYSTDDKKHVRPMHGLRSLRLGCRRDQLRVTQV